MASPERRAMGLDKQAAVTIVGMALVTHATRAGGLWVMGRLPTSPRIDAWLRHLPGAILAAIVAPAAIAGGPASALATLAAMLVMARTGNVLLAMVIGVGLVLPLRALL